MKVVCTQENLKSGLSVVGRIISSTNTLPILNNLLIKTENGQLKISATNLEVAITTNIRCKIEESGETTVSNKTLFDLVNNLPNKNITLEEKNNQLFLETENYHTNIKTLSSEEFPLIPTVDSKKQLTLDAQELRKALEQVVFAASTNQTQPEISGVFMALEKNHIRLAATDRYRLAERKIPTKQSTETSYEAIIPQKTMIELSRIIANQKGDVEMLFTETQIAINFNETQIISRLVDGQYPDYRQIIPNNFPTTVATEKGPLIGALRTAAVFSQNNNSVRLDFSSSRQQLVLTAESAELGKSSIELPAKIDGPDNGLLLNYHYLLDCLANLETGNVVIKLIDDNSPSLLIPEGSDNYIYLVMPIKS